VAANLSSTHYALDAASLPGGSQVYFKVLVSDGLRTAGDTAGPVSVPNKPPLVLMFGPKERSVFAPGEPIMLRGAATDPEDGPVAPHLLVWSSDRDGQLGTGAELAVADLSLGWHTLTLSTGDRLGATGQASVRVLVGRRLFMPIAGRGR
jgi:hypothetical protein